MLVRGASITELMVLRGPVIAPIIANVVPDIIGGTHYKAKNAVCAKATGPIPSNFLNDIPDSASDIHIRENTMEPFLVSRPSSEFPELTITVPDSWPSIQLAPLYDVHLGHPQCDRTLLQRHLDWIAETPNVISFNGGDLFDNLVDSKMGHSPDDNTKQYETARDTLRTVANKIAFSLPGNHEDRTYRVAHIDVARLLAGELGVEYFPDYCLATIHWRNQHFKLVAHHGTGAAATPGGQRNAARKDLSWTKPDLMWTGHLHQPLVDTVHLLDYNPITRSYYERDCAVIISPSYLNYFGSYAAKKRLAPGSRGLTVATLQDDGRIDVSIHARGIRI